MARYLVTGALGFIGAKVVELLLSEGHVVVGVDNLNESYDVRLKQWRLRTLQSNRTFKFERLDICDRGALRDLTKRERAQGQGGPRSPEFRGSQSPPFDAIINLAARAGVRQSVDNPWVYCETNVTGTLNLLQACVDFGIGKFVFASTSSVYGANNLTPFREDADTDGPLSPYAASKKAAELLCHTYHYLYGIDVTILRYFTVYGPAGRPDMSLFRFVQWICEGRPVTLYGDGTQERDFTYVDDVARGTVLALKPLGYEIINLGSDRPIPLASAIGILEELLGKRAEIERQPRHPADVQATWADIRKAERILSWRPQTDFRRGLGMLVDWYLQNREWVKNIRVDRGY